MDKLTREQIEDYGKDSASGDCSPILNEIKRMALSSLAPAGEVDVKRYDTLQENEPLGQVSPGDFRHRGVVEAKDGWLVLYRHYAALQAKLAEAEADRDKWKQDSYETSKRAGDNVRRMELAERDANARADKAEAENVEQARLLGMGAEREAALQARVAEWSRYSQHKSTCRNWAEIGVCTCGLNALRAALTGAQEERWGR